MIRSTVNPYDLIANSYQEIADVRKNYIHSVDKLIIKYAPQKAISMLDVGSGDGKRAMALAKELKVKNITLCDSSKEMVKLCQKLKPNNVLSCKAEELPIDPQYDIITCLWNVLGHIGSSKKRIEALRRMSKSLNNNGVLFFDINNRYNASAYGYFNVVYRMVIDRIFPNDSRGDTSYNWVIKDKQIPSMGHLFTPREVDNLIIKTGLKIINKIAVDYSTGKISNSLIRGQLLYILKI